MERFLLYLDDLDDLYGMVGLVAERVRRLVLSLIVLIVLFGGTASGVWLAFAHPPTALAVGYLLGVALLYRLVTAPTQQQSA